MFVKPYLFFDKTKIAYPANPPEIQNGATEGEKHDVQQTPVAGFLISVVTF